MQTSVTEASKSCAARGFTLIEMMVVVLLIGLMLGLGLTLDFAGSPQHQQQQAVVFAHALDVAAQEAVLDGAVWGLDFFVVAEAGERQTGYRWLVLREDGWTLPEPALPQPQLAETLFPANTTVDLAVSGESLVPEDQVDLSVPELAAGFTPEIWLLPTRELSPFRLQLDSETATAFVTGDLLGRVRVNEDVPALR